MVKSNSTRTFKMLSSTIDSNENLNGEKSPMGIPLAEYNIIAWDLDTTGRKLMDEICQIATYTPTSSFSQYVMPYRNLNQAARLRHNIKVGTMGKYRMLKDAKTGKVIKTKSEISALTDFLNWLESVQGKSGVILLNYEASKTIPSLLLLAFRKYNLEDKFASIVKGFANGCLLAEDKCAKSIKSFKLESLCKILLDKEDLLDNATVRCRLAYQICQHLCGAEDHSNNSQGGGDAETTSNSFLETICDYTVPIAIVQDELDQLICIIERQNTLHPIFSRKGVNNTSERHRSENLRHILAEAGINYDLLNETFAEGGRESLIHLLTTKLTKAKPRDLEELHVALMGHFDPESVPIKNESGYKPRRNSHRNKSLSESNDKKNIFTEKNGEEIKSIEDSKNEINKNDEENEDYKETIKIENVKIENPEPVINDVEEPLPPVTKNEPEIVSESIEIPECNDINSSDIPASNDISSSDIPACNDINSGDIPACDDIKSSDIPACNDIKSDYLSSVINSESITTQNA